MIETKSIFMDAREFVKNNAANFTLLGQFILTALVFFGLGIVYARDFIKEPPPVTIVEPAKNYQVTAPAAADEIKNMPTQIIPPTPAGNLVASKNGTAYYLTTCYNNIKEENKIYFKTEEDAQKAGFRPAKTCFK